jgi:hypothetical protein
MDNIQNCDSYINISSQTYASYTKYCVPSASHLEAHENNRLILKVALKTFPTDRNLCSWGFSFTSETNLALDTPLTVRRMKRVLSYILRHEVA